MPVPASLRAHRVSALDRLGNGCLTDAAVPFRERCDGLARQLPDEIQGGRAGVIILDAIGVAETAIRITRVRFMSNGPRFLAL